MVVYTHVPLQMVDDYDELDFYGVISAYNEMGSKGSGESYVHTPTKAELKKHKKG